VPIGQKHHQRVAVTVPISFGRLDQPLDLVRCQVLAGTKLGIWWPARRDCSILVVGATRRRCEFVMIFSPSPNRTVQRRGVLATVGRLVFGMVSARSAPAGRQECASCGLHLPLDDDRKRECKVEPWPDCDSTQIFPPCISMMRLDIASPNPAPRRRTLRAPDPKPTYPLTHQIKRETAQAPRLMVQQAFGGNWSYPLTKGGKLRCRLKVTP